MAIIEVRVRGLEGSIRAVQSLQAWKIGLHRPLGELVKRQHEHRIKDQKRAASGRPWAALKETTVARKAARGNTNPSNILIDSGAMSRSFMVTLSGDLIKLTNTAAYAFRHQDGNSRMVARPLMGISNPNVNEIRRLVTRHIQAKLRNING
jgi:phage gpG-like protein